jgi:hypothetical protein
MDSNFINEAIQVLQKNNSKVENIKLSIEKEFTIVTAKIEWVINGNFKKINLVGFYCFTLETFEKVNLEDY